MCDVLNEGTVSKAELETFLNHVPTNILHSGMSPNNGDTMRGSVSQSSVPAAEDLESDDGTRIKK